MPTMDFAAASQKDIIVIILLSLLLILSFAVLPLDSNFETEGYSRQTVSSHLVGTGKVVTIYPYTKLHPVVQ